MLFGRQLDERGLQLQRQGRLGVWGPMVGQEAAQAGLGLAMRPGDWIFPSYRRSDRPEHARPRAHRALRVLPRPVLGRRPSRSGVFPIQIMIGDQSLHAVGAGMGFALQHQPHVAVGSVGDGATSQGDFLESLNFAGRLQGPGRAVRPEQPVGHQRAARASDRQRDAGPESPGAGCDGRAGRRQ